MVAGVVLVEVAAAVVAVGFPFAGALVSPVPPVHATATSETAAKRGLSDRIGAREYRGVDM